MILFILVVFTTRAYAQTMESFCFPSEQAAANAVPILYGVLVKGQDEINREGACLDITVIPQRTEIMQRWMAIKFPEARRTSAIIQRPLTCQLELEERAAGEALEKSVVFGPGHTQIITTHGQSGSKLASIFKLTSGEKAQMSVDGRTITVTCIAKPSGFFNLQFDFHALPPQVSPAVPTTELRLSAERELAAGQEVELGTLMTETENKERKLDSATGINSGKEVTQGFRRWLLRVKSLP